jgi:hypothetical protein
MKVSRRDFVSTAGCAAAASLCAFPAFGLAANASSTKDKAGCTLLGLKSNCALPESFEGMRSALGDAHRCVSESEFASSEFLSGNFGRVVIVAGAGSVRSQTFGVLAELLERGARVVWESGAAFLEPRDFAEQRALAREYFGISIERPIDAWPQTARSRTVGDGSPGPDGTNRNARKMRAIGHERVPYVAYRWPRESHLRDFSRVTPISSTKGRVIARWGELPVAWSKLVGAGTLIFVGSPIGPALRAGDAEAHSLLGSLIAY